jgi:hypothetical protein
MFKIVMMLAFYSMFITIAYPSWAVGEHTAQLIGKKLCMDTIPQGDKFYQQCRKCEKNVKYCTGDLRDRMR